MSPYSLSHVFGSSETAFKVDSCLPVVVGLGIQYDCERNVWLWVMAGSHRKQLIKNP